MAPTTKTKARKPSKVVKPKAQIRYSHTSTKNHRFQSFSERITKLKIDPIRRRRNAEDQEELSEGANTYFGRSLEERRDLNLSQTFSAFAREAAPLCESLPAVLHNADKIVDLLVAYIEKADALSLEPLLSLLSSLAHDLDTRFEKYFPRAVITVTALAAAHSDLAVVEWSFTCLAWLFKYLSRLLTPDLRPLYDLMAPYLGKTSQKPYIIRFAAESMSFLIRKVAAIYDRDSAPLNLIVKHIFDDCRSTGSDDVGDLHREGVMTLFTDSIQSVQHGIHSSGVSLLQSMLSEIEAQPEDAHQALSDIVDGSLTSLIHHATAETFQPVQKLLISSANSMIQTQRPSLVMFASQLLFTIVSVRKGTRIVDWTPAVATLQQLVHHGQSAQHLDLAPRYAILGALAVLMQSASIDAVLPALSIFDMLRHDEWTPYFLHFCDLFARFARERFQSFLLPVFQRFVIDQWEGHETAILRLLPQLETLRPGANIICPEKLQLDIPQRLRHVSDISDQEIDASRVASANVALVAVPYLKLSESTRMELNITLLSLIRSCVVESNTPKQELLNFAMGKCFASLVDNLDGNTSIVELWPALCSRSPTMSSLSIFWRNLSRYIKLHASTSLDLEGSHMVELRTSLLTCLSMPSHEIRESALEIIQALYTLQKQPSPEILSAAVTIESTPLNLETSRSVSMNIRRLASGYSDPGLDDFMRRAITTYCFGLLHVRLSQAWNDATECLAEMCKTAVGEEIVINLSQTWLEGAPNNAELPVATRSQQPILNGDSNGFHVESEFECPNRAKLLAVCQQVFEHEHSGYQSVEDRFGADHALTPLIAENAREQALKVLSKIPNVAEKRSRMLVPVLLRWASSTEGQIKRGNEERQTMRWTRKDQKALLGVFAQFTNPKVLYRASEVYDALLNLCANGDVEIQLSALKAIFAWKNAAINQYTEHLNNLLDESKFREELSVFLQDEHDDSPMVQSEHHASLMPVLLRLLYGRAVGGDKSGQSSKRKAIFIALSRYGVDVMRMFVDIALSSLGDFALLTGDKLEEEPLISLNISPRQQVGVLNMLDDILDILGSALEPFGMKLLDAALLCTVEASRQLDRSDGSADLQDASLLRSVRHNGISCLVRIFSAFNETDHATRAKVVMDELIRPRLDKFSTENTQSISGILRVLAAWTVSPRTVRYLTEYNDDVLAKVAELFRDPSAKENVRIFILQEFIDNLLQDGAGLALSPTQVSNFVRSIGDVLKQQASREVVFACIASFTKLADLISDEKEAEDVVNVCTRLLVKPNKIIPPHTKTGLLRTLSPLLEKFGPPATPELYDAVCGLFARFHDQGSRVVLSGVLILLSQPNEGLASSAQICEDLNALGTRLDEPDYDRRMTGFAKIYDQCHDFSVQQWQPIIYNCMFYIRDGDDLATRAAASRGLERFIEVSSKDEGLKPLLSNALLRGIEFGIKEPSELVRAEYVGLLGRLVENFPDWSAVSDMKSLTVGADEEASFFTNVLHIQQHRRLRALRRLAEQATCLASSNVTKVFFPLLEHFVFDQADGDAGRTLADQTISTFGALARVLNWSAFRVVFKRYTSYLKTKEEQEKVILRLLGVLVDALQSPAKAENSDKTGVIIKDFLPQLTDYIHLKDESTVDRRMPVAITIVKLLLLLPEPEMSSRLGPVLTDICHVLRSRSQEARDQTRRTIASIVALIGSQYLGFVLKELRGALQRGYQRHVLSFTVHHVLVSVIDSYEPGDLDGCLSPLMAIIMDDIFGVTGEEKDSEDYKSAMKEIKSNKSFDTMELMAKVTPVQRLGQLVRPIRALLSENLDSKTLKKIDDLLNRLRKGVDQNPASDSRDMLIFCHEIARQVNSEKDAAAIADKPPNHRLSRYLVQPSADKSGKKGSTTSQSFKLISFALNLVRKVLRRHEDLMTPANLAGFLPMAGDALIEGHEEVQLSALRLLSAVMKLPLAELESNAPVYVKEAVSKIKAAPNMTTDSAKASLELITAVLREKRSVEIRDKDVAEVLKALKSDIDEPDRQGIIYKFLRAVLGRKTMATEVYEIMDEVGKVMITNPDRNVRESARSAYLQFVLEYPQGRDRWKKQAAFFVENLKYDRPEGRQSIMELLHQLLPRLPDEVFAQLLFTLFVCLVPVQANDEDQSCRRMAGVLVGKIFERVDGEQMDTIYGLMEKWLHNEANQTIRVASLRCWIVLLRAKLPSPARLQALRDDLEPLVAVEEEDDTGTENELSPIALQVFEVLVDAAPEVTFAQSSIGIWNQLRAHLSSSQIGIKELAARLLERYFTNFAIASSKSAHGLNEVPLQGSGGLLLNADDMRQFCYASLKALRSKDQEENSETFVAQTARNIVFLGRCFAANGITWRVKANVESDDDEEANEEPTKPRRDDSAIANLFNRLSYIIRQETLPVTSRAAAVNCQTALINHVETILDLPTTLAPLYLLTDPAIPQPPGEAHQGLRDIAQELLSAVQKKVGTETYVAALGVVRSQAKVKREERRQKRRIDAVSAPERWAKEKRKKYDAKKAKTKVKGLEMGGRRRGW